MANTVSLEGFGGGGQPLNFRVVGGEAQPDSGRENTIWAITPVKITGYYIQPEQPENMQLGELWIRTGASSTVAFNAVKKGTVMVYPITAKQMTGDGLLDVPAKTYQNGEWVDWIPLGTLFANGYTAEDVTGGWGSFDYTYYGSSYTMVEPVIGDVIHVEIAGKTQACVAGVRDKVDLTGVKKLYAECEEAVGESTLRVCETRDAYHALASAIISAPGIIELPVNIDTSAYIAVVIGGSSSNASAKAKISRIRKE